MGIYVELHSTSGETIDRQELKKRLIEVGAKPYPEDPDYDTSGMFMVSGVKGSIQLGSEGNIRNGRWALVRLSWAAEADSWKRLLKDAERINGRIYDSKSDQNLTYDTIDEVMEGYCNVGIDMLGKAGKKEETKKNELPTFSNDKEFFRKNSRRKHPNMSKGKLTDVLKRIITSDAEKSVDVLEEDIKRLFPNSDIISKEDIDPEKNRWVLSLIIPLLHFKKMLGSAKEPSRICNEIERRTTERLDTNSNSQSALKVLNDYIMKLLLEKHSEEKAESINLKLWSGTEKVKYLAIFNTFWEAGVINAAKDYTEKTLAERRVSIAKEMNEAIDNIVQEIKYQNRNQSK